LLTSEQTGQFHFILIGCHSNVLIRLGSDEWIVLLLRMFRATSMSNGVSNAHLIILTEVTSKTRFSSFVNNMDARPDCELPHHLAALGVSLWMSKDVQRLEGVDRRV